MCRAATTCTRRSSTAATRCPRACPSRSTCWSRRSARWRSTWSWKNGEGAGLREQGAGKSHALAALSLLPAPCSLIPFPPDFRPTKYSLLSETSNERPSEPLQPADPAARLRRDQDLAGLARPDPLVVVGRSEETRNHQLPHLQAGA